MAVKVVLNTNIGKNETAKLVLDEADSWYVDPDSGYLNVLEDGELVASFAPNVAIFAVTAETPEELPSATVFAPLD
nr:hypothetical protein [Rhodococcus sp. (in: high G+C Gram-positive bacteria)]